MGHFYLRQIILEQSKQRIAFHLKDGNSSQTDSFFFDVDSNSFDFSIVKHFTGLEWHNRIENTPYPIRYEVEISDLAYGVNDNAVDLESLAYFHTINCCQIMGVLQKNILSLFITLRLKMGSLHTELAQENTTWEL